MPPENSLITPSYFITRRLFTAAALALPLAACGDDKFPKAELDFSAIEAKTNAKLGVAAIDLASGRMLTKRRYQRFPMCSTFKWLLAALYLQKVDAGEESLDRFVKVSKSDLIIHSPETQKWLSKGEMSIAQLCRASIQRSDNAATNLLLDMIGGPEGFTALVKENGDKITRLANIEPALNEAVFGDVPDTTSPDAMLSNMKNFVFGKKLKDDSRALLQEWMIGSRTGVRRLRHGFPTDWQVGSKTGTSTNNANNDVGFGIPPEYPESNLFGPILIVSFSRVKNATSLQAERSHRLVAEGVVNAFRISDSEG